MEDTKRRLFRAGQDILQDPGDGPRNGILIHGAPGNGKSLFGESLAGELGIPFLSVAFGDMASKWINETPERLRGLFRTARRCAPCVLLIDEIDSFLKPRDGSGATHSMDRDVVNTLLKEIVELRSARVILIGITNYIEQLDVAAIRSGRFDFHIQVPAPDFEARRRLIWAPIVQRFGREAIDAQVVNELARRWEGFSAARLAALTPQLREMQRDGVFDRTVTFDLAMRAMRLIQGQRGSSLPKHVVPIEQLVLPKTSRKMLNELASRLAHIYEFTVMGGTLPPATLFYGPPGTGKSMAVMSLAKASGFAFFTRTGTDLISRPDEWEKLVRLAHDQRPAIVFIDEADSILADRRHSSTSALTNQLLATIDGTGEKVQDVIYIAATNHPDILDPAALRGGRFAMKIRFDVPDAEAMRAWIKSTLDDRQMRLDFELEDGVEEVATQLLAGHPIADARALLEEAINICAMRHLRGLEDELVLRREDMQNAAQTLHIDAREFPA
ncbi:AAA family ATPase [Paraburkholderia bannensis]|uniref:AAA family ATPase n=1 Tax=Paraburkholderia bannensis TaxID=765414 RepID=UPI002AB6B1A8|nr:AAA family ATPase [Paraburkholderia bannensis]